MSWLVVLKEATARRADARTKLRQYTALVLDRQPRETLAAYATSAVALSGLLALQCGADAPWKFALAGTGCAGLLPTKTW
jgi:hypothetical protein